MELTLELCVASPPKRTNANALFYLSRFYRAVHKSHDIRAAFLQLGNSRRRSEPTHRNIRTFWHRFPLILFLAFLTKRLGLSWNIALLLLTSCGLNFYVWRGEGRVKITGEGGERWGRQFFQTAKNELPVALKGFWWKIRGQINKFRITCVPSLLYETKDR